MTKWLPDLEIEINSLPLHCQHYVGAGGAVVDMENRQILLIRERYQSIEPNRKDMWKIPTGTLDKPGENIAECAVREVQEETGCTSEFIGVIGFRHLHNYRFGK